MSKTNKTIIAAIVGVAAAYTGGSWYLGKQIQSGIEATIADANTRYASQTFSGLNDAPDLVETIEYDRGIFSSSAKYNITAVGAQGKTIAYEVTSDIDHGFFPKQAVANGIYTPLLAYANTSFNLSKDIANQVGLEQDTAAANAISTVKLNGNSTSNVSILPLVIDIDDVVLDFSGGNMTVDLKNHQSNADINGVFDTYSIKHKVDNEVIEIKDITINSKVNLLDDGNNQSTSILFDSVGLFSSNNDIETNAKNIKIDLESEQKNDILKAQVKYNIEQIFVDNKDVGNFDFGVQLDNFNLPVLIAIGQKYTELIDKHGVTSFSDLNLSSTEQQQWIEQIMPFLAAKPSIHINPLAWGNSAGTSQASFKISVSGAEQNNDSTISVEKIVENATFNLQVSRAMIMEMFKVMAQGNDGAQGADEVGAMLFDQYANLLVSQGLATQDDDNLFVSIDVSPAQDQTSINDKTMTLNEFFMLAFGLIMFM